MLGILILFIFIRSLDFVAVGESLKLAGVRVIFIISCIIEHQIIQKILEHLDLWAQKPSRDPPHQNTPPINNDLVYEPFNDGWPEYEEPYIVLN